ncbi:hypothetical protein RND81_05G145200 [Saponaria officinalis]|uniref:CCHC-type domain-containing protein n=1 Tax=Saponaria officinalis TaxID=3572 RepID=A0AAW1KY43_SAPOF
MTRTLTNKLLLKQRLFGLRMQEVSLPSSYENFVESLVVGKETLTLEEVNSSLHTRELRQKATNVVVDNQALGLVAKAEKERVQTGGNKKKSYRPKSKGPSSSDYCHNCGEKGHWKLECPKSKRENFASYAAARQSKSDYDSEDDLVLVVQEKKHLGDRWVLDSGCTSHMCSKREMFLTYSHHRSTVTMGDGAICEAVGIGSVKFLMHDGNVRYLIGVRHIPQLKSNLISLGMLDHRGFRFQGKGGVLRVCKGPWELLRGVKSSAGNLYLLQGKALTRGISPSKHCGNVEVSHTRPDGLEGLNLASGLIVDDVKGEVELAETLVVDGSGSKRRSSTTGLKSSSCVEDDCINGKGELCGTPKDRVEKTNRQEEQQRVFQLRNGTIRFGDFEPCVVNVSYFLSSNKSKPEDIGSRGDLLGSHQLASVSR